MNKCKFSVTYSLIETSCTAIVYYQYLISPFVYVCKGKIWNVSDTEQKDEYKLKFQLKKNPF